MTRKAYNRFRMCICSGYPWPHRQGSKGSAHSEHGPSRSPYRFCRCERPNKRLTAPF